MSLEVRAVMNSAVEEVFGFRSCCGMRAFDQNLEIRIANTGSRPVTLQSHMDLKGHEGVHRVRNLMPHGELRIPPGDVRAFYCTMDEKRWEKVQEIVLYDREGREHTSRVG